MFVEICNQRDSFDGTRNKHKMCLRSGFNLPPLPEDLDYVYEGKERQDVSDNYWRICLAKLHTEQWGKMLSLWQVELDKQTKFQKAKHDAKSKQLLRKRNVRPAPFVFKTGPIITEAVLKVLASRVKPGLWLRVVDGILEGTSLLKDIRMSMQNEVSFSNFLLKLEYYLEVDNLAEARVKCGPGLTPQLIHGMLNQCSKADLRTINNTKSKDIPSTVADMLDKMKLCQTQAKEAEAARVESKGPGGDGGEKATLKSKFALLSKRTSVLKVPGLGSVNVKTLLKKNHTKKELKAVKSTLNKNQNLVKLKGGKAQVLTWVHRPISTLHAYHPQAGNIVGGVIENLHKWNLNVNEGDPVDPEGYHDISFVGFSPPWGWKKGIWDQKRFSRLEFKLTFEQCIALTSRKKLTIAVVVPEEMVSACVESMEAAGFFHHERLTWTQSGGHSNASIPGMPPILCRVPKRHLHCMIS
jgi:hypothetical protein